MTKIATVALVTTGLSHTSAEFQARSALTGVGFTTRESERIVGHPIRRKIVLSLMLMGNAGIVTAITSLVIAFVHDGGSALPRFFFLTLGLLGAFLLSKSKWFDDKLTWAINAYLDKYKDVLNRDYIKLMQLSGEYMVTELSVEKDNWLCGQSLGELDLSKEGVLVLGLEREGDFKGVPSKNITLSDGDLLVLFGRESSIRNIEGRKKGDLGDHEHYSKGRIQKKLEAVQDQSLAA